MATATRRPSEKPPGAAFRARQAPARMHIRRDHPPNRQALKMLTARTRNSLATALALGGAVLLCVAGALLWTGGPIGQSSDIVAAVLAAAGIAAFVLADWLAPARGWRNATPMIDPEKHVSITDSGRDQT